MELKYILGEPDYVEGVGNIYPVKIKDYDEFQKYADILYFSKNNFNETEEPLLLLILVGLEPVGLSQNDVIGKLQKVFQMVLKTDNVSFFANDDDYGFLIDYKYIINSKNYDTVRKIIMKQNLMFEPKVYKNEMTRKWAEKIIKTRLKNSIKITLEDKIRVVHVVTGIPYDVLKEQTVYQLESDFAQITQIKDYDRDIEFTCAGAKINIKHFAEQINLFKNPYDDLFVDSSKLNKLNKAIQ